MAKVLDSDTVKSIVKDELTKFVNDSFDKEVKKVLHNSNGLSRAEMISMTKSALESVFKTLWAKKDFWKNEIK